MNAFPFDSSITTAMVLPDNEPRPKAVERTTLKALCERAGIPLRVTGALTPPVVLHGGEEHWRTEKALYVGEVRGWTTKAERALRILEVLAHGFHDYAARECVCFHGLFSAGSPPRRRGRPSLGDRAMTAAERMRKMRRHRVDVARQNR